MSQFSNSIVDIHYQQTGAATAVNPLGMREMQAKAYEEGLKRVVVAVPEKEHRTLVSKHTANAIRILC